MRARPNLAAEQLVTDYLTRVAQAARLLPKGARIAFVGRTRALVEREVGPPGTRTDPQHVSEVLTRLGEPEDLVNQERTRIDQSWLKSRAASKEEGEAAAAALTEPRMNRPLTSRRRPNSATQPLFGKPAQPGPGETATGPDGTGGGQGGSVTGGTGPAQGLGPQRPVLRSAGPRSAGSQTAGPWSAGSPSAGAPDTGSRTAGPTSGAPRRLQSADPLGTGQGPGGQRPGGPGPGGQRPGGQDPGGQDPGGQGPAPQASQGGTGAAGAETEGGRRTNPIDWLIGQVPGKHGTDGAETVASGVARLARDHVLETVAILLLGLGGLILPLPFWPIGAIVTMFSRVWDVKDKALAVVGPLLVTLAVSVPVALFVGGGSNPVVIYFHAVHVSFGLLVRVGSVITAAYLAWRVSQGPRVKAPPWRRITR